MAVGYDFTNLSRMTDDYIRSQLSQESFSPEIRNDNDMDETFMSITEQAKALVQGDRKTDYGDMSASFTRIAGLWSAYLGVHVDKYDVAKMMMLLKVSRAKHGNHYDSYVDIVGYVECVEHMLADARRDD